MSRLDSVHKNLFSQVKSSRFLYVQLNYDNKTFVVLFVVGSLFPPSSIFKFQFDQESDRQRTTLWMCYLQIIMYLFNRGV